MPRKKGQKIIVWEDHEISIVFSATRDVLKVKPRLSLLEAIREGQLELRTERRRNLSGLAAVPKPLLQKFIEYKMLDPNWQEMGRKRKKVAPEALVVPELEELRAKLATANQTIEEQAAVFRQQEARIKELEAVPGPMQMIINVVRNMIAEGVEEGLRRRAAINPGTKTEELLGLTRAAGATPIPKFEQERRRNPFGGTESGSVTKPKFALVADFVGSDKAVIHEKLGDMCEVRYMDSTTKMQGLKEFNANGGRVVLWTDHAGHEFEKQLKSLGVSFSRMSGSLPSLIQQVQAKAQEARSR